MNPSFIQVSLALLAGIALIVLLTTKWRIHPFFALLAACFVVGWIVQMPALQIVNTAKEGFGNILKSLGFIVVLGTALGVILEKTGSTRTMANYILAKTGKKHPALAMSITGLIVGLPIFCDSGFIVLSGLNHTLAKRTGVPVVVMAASMATGLYSVHCLLPPHPGAAGAAGIIGAAYGKLMIAGIIVAVPAMLAAYFYISYAGRKIIPGKTETGTTVKEETEINNFNTLRSFLPLMVPVILIAVKSFLPDTITLISFLGDPVIALSVGVILALAAGLSSGTAEIRAWLQESVEKAGGILVIIGAGGAFGAILAATQIGRHFSEALPLAGMGLLFPFLLTAVLKTAQGSSTVAIITAASVIQPLLSELGFVSPDQKLICVLAMGAGSMMISHANDAYFWVIAKFGKLDMPQMLKIYSPATAVMGMVSLLMVYLLSLFL